MRQPPPGLRLPDGAGGRAGSVECVDHGGAGLLDGCATAHPGLGVVDQPRLMQGRVEPCLQPGRQGVLLLEERDVLPVRDGVGVVPVDARPPELRGRRRRGGSLTRSGFRAHEVRGEYQVNGGGPGVATVPEALSGQGVEVLGEAGPLAQGAEAMGHQVRQVRVPAAA